MTPLFFSKCKKKIINDLKSIGGDAKLERKVSIQRIS